MTVISSAAFKADDSLFYIRHANPTKNINGGFTETQKLRTVLDYSESNTGFSVYFCRNLATFRSKIARFAPSVSKLLYGGFSCRSCRRDVVDETKCYTGFFLAVEVETMYRM